MHPVIEASVTYKYSKKLTNDIQDKIDSLNDQEARRYIIEVDNQKSALGDINLKEASADNIPNYHKEIFKQNNGSIEPHPEAKNKITEIRNKLKDCQSQLQQLI